MFYMGVSVLEIEIEIEIEIEREKEEIKPYLSENNVEIRPKLSRSTKMFFV